MVMVKMVKLNFWLFFNICFLSEAYIRAPFNNRLV